MTSRVEDFEANADLARKIYECYRFLAANTGGKEVLIQKIDALAEEHLLSL